MTLDEYIINLCEGGIAISARPSVFPNQLDSDTLFNKINPVDNSCELPQPDDSKVEINNRESIPLQDNSENNMGKQLHGPNKAMENSPTQDKYTLSNDGEFDHMDEDVCGTGGIAIGAGVFQPIKKKRKMTKNIRENNAVDKPKGTPISDKSAKQMKYKADSTMSQAGKQWPRKHTETPAMCDVDEDGVEHKPQGVHQSKPSKAADGHLDKVGHDWPSKPHNDGGTFEEFGNSLQGAEVHAGDVKENWSRLDIASGVKGMPSMQAMFDSYARIADCVTTEEFKHICGANGYVVNIGDNELLHLLNANQQFVFHEMHDSNGVYWVKTLVESSKPWEKATDDEETDTSESDDDCDDGMHCESVKSAVNMIAEDLGHDDYGMSHNRMGGHDFGGGIDRGMGDDLDLGMHDDEFGEGGDEFGGEFGDDEFGGDEFGGDEFGEGEFGEGDVEYNPEFGMSDDDMGNDVHNDFGELGSNLAKPEMGGRPEMGRGRPNNRPEMNRFESVNKFLRSAKGILESSAGYTNRDVADALTHAWDTYVGVIDLRECTESAKKAVIAISRRYPDFQPTVTESEAMDNVGGTGLQSKSTKNVAGSNKAEMSELQGGSLLKRHPKNDVDKTPTVKGGPGSMSENIQKAARAISESIKSNAKTLGGKKYNVTISAVLREGTTVKRSKPFPSIKAAAAKIIEMKTANPKSKVKLEAVFNDGKKEHVKLIG